jgi:hypothetical protein
MLGEVTALSLKFIEETKFCNGIELQGDIRLK